MFPVMYHYGRLSSKCNMLVPKWIVPRDIFIIDLQNIKVISVVCSGSCIISNNISSFKQFKKADAAHLHVLGIMTMNVFIVYIGHWALCNIIVMHYLQLALSLFGVIHIESWYRFFIGSATSLQICLTIIHALALADLNIRDYFCRACFPSK